MGLLVNSKNSFSDLDYIVIPSRKEAILSAEEFRGRSSHCKNSLYLEGLGNWSQFWKNASDIDRSNCCSKLNVDTDLFEGGDGLGLYEREVAFKKGIVRAVYLRIVSEKELSFDLSFKIESGVRLVFCVLGEILDGANISFKIRVNQLDKSSFVFKGRFVTGEGGSLNVATSGVLDKGCREAESLFDTKVLQLGAGAKIECVPEMTVSTGGVDATHGFSVGSVPYDKCNYLMNRGFSDKEAKEIYAKGFLKEVLSL